MAERKTVTIPWPTIAPLDVEITIEGVQEVWDLYIKPAQEDGSLQSVEMRMLMAILRAVYEGLMQPETLVRSRQTESPATRRWRLFGWRAMPNGPDQAPGWDGFDG